MKRDDPKVEIRFNGEGLWVLQGNEIRGRVQWTEVLEIFSFKVDRFTFDEICVGFRLDEAGTYFWVSEEFLGYEDLLKDLKTRFLGFSEDWFSDVAFPAFVENRTTLWGVAVRPNEK